jgi:hypothetical protein
MDAQTIGVLAVAVGGLYSLFSAAVIILKGGRFTLEWINARKKPRRSSTYIIFPSPEEIMEFGSDSRVTDSTFKRPSRIERLNSVVHERIEVVKLAMFLAYFAIAVRAVWLALF